MRKVQNIPIFLNRVENASLSRFSFSRKNQIRETLCMYLTKIGLPLRDTSRKMTEGEEILTTPKDEYLMGLIERIRGLIERLGLHIDPLPGVIGSPELSQTKYNERGTYEIFREQLLSRIEQTSGKKLTPQELEVSFARLDQIYLCTKSIARHFPDRKSGETAFTHFFDTVFILTKEFPNATLEEIELAFGHDLIEETIDLEGISTSFRAGLLQQVRDIFGRERFSQMRNLSKKSLTRYITPTENIYRNTLPEAGRKLWIDQRKDSLKLRRNEEYFGELGRLPMPLFRVKLADRISNLRSLHAKRNKRGKCEETILYFLGPTKARSPTGFILIMRELVSLNEIYKLGLETLLAPHLGEYAKICSNEKRGTRIS